VRVTPASQPLPVTELLGDQAGKLRCLACGSPLELTFVAEHPGYPELGPDGTLSCAACPERYPLIAASG